MGAQRPRFLPSSRFQRRFMRHCYSCRQIMREESENHGRFRYPSLYQINTRVWLTEFSRTLGKPATLDDIPDAELDRLAEKGFDWIWFLSVWQTGPAAQAVSRSNAGWRKEFQETCRTSKRKISRGSGFAITELHRASGSRRRCGAGTFRKRMKKRGLKLMLDFVPNHMAPDHPWVEQHPDYFVPAADDDLARAPQNYRCQAKR